MKKKILLLISLIFAFFPALVSANNYILYYWSSCPHCHKVIDYLEENNITIEKKEVYNNTSSREDFVEKVESLWLDSKKVWVPFLYIEKDNWERSYLMWDTPIINLLDKSKLAISTQKRSSEEMVLSSESKDKVMQIFKNIVETIEIKYDTKFKQKDIYLKLNNIISEKKGNFDWYTILLFEYLQELIDDKISVLEITSNWKLLKNEELGFSFYYPNNLSWTYIWDSEPDDFDINTSDFFYLDTKDDSSKLCELIRVSINRNSVENQDNLISEYSVDSIPFENTVMERKASSWKYYYKYSYVTVWENVIQLSVASDMGEENDEICKKYMWYIDVMLKTFKLSEK